MGKKLLGMNVLDAAKERISYVFDNFSRISVSFSGGKDSTVMLHLVMSEAINRNRKVGVLFIDLEGQYELTINHIQDMYNLYSEYIEPYWVCLPISLRNAVSLYEHKWISWDKDKKEAWVRNPPDIAITDYDKFPFYRYAMEFEEFVPEFSNWYGNGQECACFVGIRTNESLNRWRTIAGHGTKWIKDGVKKKYIQISSNKTCNIYPIYDWIESDIWAYHGKTKLPYNKLYDRMYSAGLSLHQMRICQPYGDDQRKGLWLFHIIEPQTWAKIVARVNGANGGSLYAQESGNILGNIKISKPDGHSWESFTKLLLGSMPQKTKTHFENKIAVFIRWAQNHGYPNGIPDEMPRKDESEKCVPSWRRICKTILKYDYWCKGLSFSHTKNEAYQKYLDLMKRRREKWNII